MLRLKSKNIFVYFWNSIILQLANTMAYHLLKRKKVPLSRCWKWIMEFIQSLFHTPRPSSFPPPPPPPMELCTDFLFDIFLHLPPEVLPRFSCLNKHCVTWSAALCSLESEASPPSPFCYCVLPAQVEQPDWLCLNRQGVWYKVRQEWVP